MADRLVVVDNLRIRYDGVFNMNELYLLIDKYYREKGYDKCERQMFEHQYTDGKQIEVVLEPWKKINDYVQNEMRIIILVTNLKNVDVKKDGHTVKLNHGRVQISFIGWLRWDYYHKWDGTPILFFLRVLFDRYFFRKNTEKFENYCMEEVEGLYNLVRKYLNMYKLRYRS